MVGRLVGIAAIVAMIILTASFVMFANDEASKASETQQGIADGTGPATYQTDEKGRKLERSDLRRRIDRVSDALTSPVEPLVEDNTNRWVKRGVPWMIGMAFWGVGGLFLARYLRTIG